MDALDELRDMVNRTVIIVRQVMGDDDAWRSPRADSQAGAELTAEEARCPEPLAGSWPWLVAPLVGSWALQVAAEQADAFTKVLDPGDVSYAADVLCRTVIESASLAWWLLDPNIDAPTRTARALLYRYHTAKQTKSAIKALELRPDELSGAYGELPETVLKDIESSGIVYEPRKAFKIGDEVWPSYTDRVAGLIEVIWPHRKLPYAMLSAVAHSDLVGLQRNLVWSPSGMRVAAGEATWMWMWTDTYLVVGALAFTAKRAADFCGLDEVGRRLWMFMTEVEKRLLALRPPVG